MCKDEEKNQLIAIIDEMVGAAVSMNQGTQNYDSFINSRVKAIRKIEDLFTYRHTMTTAIQDLHELVNS